MSDDAPASVPEPASTSPSPALPPLVAITTSMGQCYALGEAYPDLPAEVAREVPANVVAIVEDEAENDVSGRVYLIRAEPGPAPGFAWRDRVSGAAVVSVARAVAEEQAEAADRADEDNPDTGIDVRRVLARHGALAVVIEAGRPLPELGAWPGWLRGEVTRIIRQEDGFYRVRVTAKPAGPIPAGCVITLTILEQVSALEVLPAEEARAEEEAAELAQLQELENMLQGGGGEEEGDGEEESDDGA